MNKAWRRWGELPYCFSMSSVKFQRHTATKKSSFFTQIGRFRTVTPSWIHIWLCTNIEVAEKRCPIVFQSHLSNLMDTGDKKSPILTRIGRFRTVTYVWINWWLWHDAQSLKQHRRGLLLFFKVIREISRSHGTRNHWFWPKLSVSNFTLNKQVDLKWCTKLHVV